MASDRVNTPPGVPLRCACLRDDVTREAEAVAADGHVPCVVEALHGNKRSVRVGDHFRRRAGMGEGGGCESEGREKRLPVRSGHARQPTPKESAEQQSLRRMLITAKVVRIQKYVSPRGRERAKACKTRM